MSSTEISDVHAELATEAATAEQVAGFISCSMIFFLNCKTKIHRGIMRYPK